MEAISVEHFKEYARTILDQYKPLQKRQYSRKLIDEQAEQVKKILDGSNTVHIDPQTRSKIIEDTVQECRELYFSMPPMFKRNKLAFSRS